MRLLLAGSNLIRRLAIVLDFMRISWVVQAKGRTVIWTRARTLFPFSLYVCIEPQADAATGPPFSGGVALISGLLGWGIGSLEGLCLYMTVHSYNADMYVFCPDLDGNPRSSVQVVE